MKLRLNISKAIPQFMSVAALTAVTVGSVMAATPGEINFTTLFSPDPIPSSGGLFNIITVDNNTATGQFAPSQVILSNFKESSTTGVGGANIVNSDFDIAITAEPDGDNTPVTEHLLGNISGSFNSGATNLVLTTTTPSLAFNFGSFGTYTFDTFTFVAPGISTSTQAGSLGATISYSAVPEASASASLGLLLALGLGGIIVARKRTVRA